LISENKTIQDFCETLAATVQKPFQIYTNLKDAAAAHLKFPEACFFFDFANPSHLQEFNSHFGECAKSGKLNSNHLFCIGSTLGQEVKDHIDSDWFGHYIQIRSKDTTTTAKRLAKVIESYDGTFDPQNLKFLLDPNATIILKHYSDSSSKTAILQHIYKFISQEVGLLHRVSSAIMNAADELVMNAIYDAPLRAGRGRTTLSFEILNQSPLDVQIGFDDHAVAITVIDYCGSITRTALYTHVLQALSDTKFEALTDSSGAGIGLATTFRTGGSLLYHCIPSKQTSATVLFRRTQSYKEFQTQDKFISTFLQNENYSFLPKNTALNADPIILENK
jgi:hypothetical protein